MTIEEILKVGAAPNADCNTTLAQAKAMEVALAPFMVVKGTVINTTISQPVDASLISVKGLSIPADSQLFLHVQVQASGRVIEVGVANWWRIVASIGMREAVIMILNIVNTNWMQDKVLLAKLYTLDLVSNLDKPPALIDPTTALVLPRPDWDKAVGTGRFAIRAGDDSPIGIKYTSLETGVVWVKCGVPGLGGIMSDGHWETEKLT